MIKKMYAVLLEFWLRQIVVGLLNFYWPGTFSADWEGGLIEWLIVSTISFFM